MDVDPDLSPAARLERCLDSFDEPLGRLAIDAWRVPVPGFLLRFSARDSRTKSSQVMPGPISTVASPTRTSRLRSFV
ncbi:MAG: hypothetical protein ACYTGD_02360 [Planctomycetota bacterium]